MTASPSSLRSAMNDNAPALPASIRNLVNPTKRISCAETAKLIRKALKEAFPEVKFSVKSSVYSMGASISVRWSEGPLTSQVEAITDVFAGSSFDAMTDSKTRHRHALDGQPVSFGADYVHCYRSQNWEKITALAAILDRADKGDWHTLAVRSGVSGRDAEAALSYHPSAQDFAESMLHSMPRPHFDGRRSKTAEAVTFLE